MLLSCPQRAWSTSSDVWSLGVTLWELFSLCRTRPLAELSDLAVEEQLLRAGAGHANLQLLAPPTACPPEVWALVGRCCEGVAEDRPSAREVHLTLRAMSL